MFGEPARPSLHWVRSRRWLRGVSALALALGGIVTAMTLLLGTQGAAATGAGRAFRVAVSSLTLPKSGDYSALAVLGGRLLVLGGAEASLAPWVSIAVESNGRLTPLHSRPSATCDTAVVDTATLRLSDLMTANCADPAIYHERAIAVSYWVNSRNSPSGTLIETRIARSDPAAPDGYTLGPVVMSYSQCSDCWAQQIYGDGSLWIYDQVTPAGSRFTQVGQLLRISEASGAVMQRWQMPSIDRPLVAVNSDGFWFAPSNESGWPERTPQSQIIRYQSLYHVWPGAHAPERVLPVGGGGGTLWLVASGHTVWLETNHDPKLATLWRLTGSGAKPARLGSYPENSTQGGEYGEGAPTYAGNAAIGIYYVTTSSPTTYQVGRTTQRIVRLASDAPTEQTVAVITAPSTITANSFAFSSPPAAALGNSFFFLDPPNITYPAGTKPPIIQGAGVLYRVTPDPAP